MKTIAFFGLKGLPPKYGGLQFDAEEIGKHLVKNGYEVTVYCRKWYQGDYQNQLYKGMILKVINSPKFSTFIDVFFHTLMSCYFAIKDRIDVAYFFSAGSYFAILICRIFKIKTIIRRNGFSYKTTSYNKIGRIILYFSELFGITFADIITTETIIEKAHANKYTKKKIFVTPVGIIGQEKIKVDLIKQKFLLNGNDYILFIGRFVRVKRIEWLIYSFLELLETNNLKLIIAGSSDDRKYISYLKRIGNNKRILFPGYVDGRLKEELISNSFCMILPSESEGMSTAVMETMSYGGICLLSDIEVHRWIINDKSIGLLFNHNDSNDLTKKIKGLIDKKYVFDSSRIKKKILERFNKEKILNEIVEIIE